MGWRSTQTERGIKMAERREPKAWITVNGKHVPIFDENWIPQDVRDTYSRFVDDRSMDKHLDSDELTWVEALRKEKQIKQNEQEADGLNRKEKQPTVKPWSKAEEKRSQDISKLIDEKLRTGGWGEYYETDGGETVEEFDFEIPGGRTTEIRIGKNTIVYAGNFDENDHRVKKGKSVKGTTHYTVSDDGETIDDSYMGYKTLADARHAAKLYMERAKKTWR